MPDFDANDDPLRLSGAGQDEPLEPAVVRPRWQPRARELAVGQCYARYGRPARRVGVTCAAQRRRAVRRACPWRLLAPPRTAPRRRRRLWTVCHGRAPGSPS